MWEQVGSVTRKKSSDFHGKIRFQSRFTIRWELEDKNFLKIDIICRLDCKPLFWKTSPQRKGRGRKSSLRSCQYPGHTLDHTGKITSVAGRHVVNFQLATEISQSFVPSFFFLLHANNCLNVQRYFNFSI